MKKQKSRLEKIVETLLKNRGVNTEKEREEFFSPTDPEKISAKRLGISDKEIEKAVKRIKQAIKKKEKIIVWGDYDVDGICASAILWETLDSLGANVIPHIPSRFTEGYGLSIDSIKKLCGEKKVDLIITVDNGITANEKIDFAATLGVDVIITDHHQPGEVVPSAYAVIHTTQISGSAVAWFLSRELLRAEPAAKQLPTHQLPADHLGLAALGTVADVLPLVGINRAIVMYGLEFLRKSKRPGLIALCVEAGIEQGEINTFHIGFLIAPRLNAAGRLEHAFDSLRLLCTRNPMRSQALARKLGATNRLRQEKTMAILEHIGENFAEGWRDGKSKLLIAHHSTYEEGIVGVVAGRLAEKYYRPALVVFQGEEISKGSARSVAGVNIVETIKAAGDGLLASFGGHPMAAGFTVETSKFEIFKQKILSFCQKEIPDDCLVRKAKFDCEVSFAEAGIVLYSNLLKFAPFGAGNPEPTFLTKGVTILDARLVGKQGNHVKLLLEKDGIKFGGIAFGMQETYGNLDPQKLVDIVFCLDENDWNGKKELQLKVKNILQG